VMSGSAHENLMQLGALDPQQAQQMSAMMAMAAGAPLLPPGHGPAGCCGLGLEAAMAAATNPSVDPAMAQAYAAQAVAYLQQANLFASGVDPSVGGMGVCGGCMGVPPPFQPMPYAAPTQSAPAISVSVEGMKFQYQLTEDDLRKVFSRYGQVKAIQVDEGGTVAQILFETLAQAQKAILDLNGKVLQGLEGTLRLAWAGQSVPLPPYPMPPVMGWGFPSGAPWPPAPSMGRQEPCATDVVFQTTISTRSDLASSGTGPTEGGPSGHVKGVRKHTCRFLIGIDNDREFQVVRRIIGAKGANMKRIVRQTDAKLRLRGVGSGYFEGASQRESSEPLQLCVSCTTAEGYQTAVREVEELLEHVYDDYRQQCRDTGKPEPELHAVPQLVSQGRDRAPDVDAASPIGQSEESRRRGRRARPKRGAAVDRGSPPPLAPPSEEIERMVDARNEARRQCNFVEADRIRQSLHERGVALMDEPGGRGKGSEVTTWRYWRD